MTKHLTQGGIDRRPGPSRAAMQHYGGMVNRPSNSAAEGGNFRKVSDFLAGKNGVITPPRSIKE
jgi:hypothetical protein